VPFILFSLSLFLDMVIDYCGYEIKMISENHIKMKKKMLSNVVLYLKHEIWNEI